MSKPYGIFANYYDYLMTDVDYDAWTERIIQVIKQQVVNGKTLVDLACGTGNISNRLARKGYRVTGIDISEEMLMIAQDKAYEKNLRIQYFKQDMKQFKIHQKVDIITCICDGINYLLTDEALETFFKNASQQLVNEGLMVIDMSSVYKYEHVLSKRTIAELDDQVSFIWENHYDLKTGILEFDIAFFVPEPETEFFRKLMEHHVQKSHTLENLEKAYNNYFDCVQIVDGETGLDLHESSERWLLALKKRRMDYDE